jgi:hypothetical protein
VAWSSTTASVAPIEVDIAIFFELRRHAARQQEESRGARAREKQ